MSRWLTWKPHQIFWNCPQEEPTKPTKPSFDGFVGSSPAHFQKIRLSTEAPEDSWEWIQERAAIMKIDGGLNRDEANHCAFLLWYRRFVGEWPDGDQNSRQEQSEREIQASGERERQ